MITNDIYIYRYNIYIKLTARYEKSLSPKLAKLVYPKSKPHNILFIDPKQIKSKFPTISIATITIIINELQKCPIKNTINIKANILLKHIQLKTKKYNLDIKIYYQW
jgi:hypothetical protein